MKLLQYSKEKANRLRPMGLLFQFQERSNFCPRKFVTGKLAPRERERVVIMILLYCYIPFICCQLSCDDDHAMQCFMIKEKVKVYSGSEIPNFLLSVVKQPSKWLVARPTLIGPSSPLSSPPPPPSPATSSSRWWTRRTGW